MSHTFTKAGTAGVTFSVAPVWPYSKRIQPRAKIGRNDNGSVVVATLGSPDTFYELRFEDLTQDDVDALDAFFAAIGHQAQTFSWTDHLSTVRTARLWDSDIAISQHAPDCFDVTLNILVGG
jgi:hypothetical protein